jgi:hypothetical protein
VHGVSSNQHSDRYEHLQAGRAARDPGIPDRAAGAPEPSKADANSTISKCTLASGPLEVALARHVLFVPLRTVPLISVALDGEASLHAFDHHIDAVAMIGGIADAHLRAHKFFFIRAKEIYPRYDFAPMNNGEFGKMLLLD